MLRIIPVGIIVTHCWGNLAGPLGDDEEPRGGPTLKVGVGVCRCAVACRRRPADSFDLAGRRTYNRLVPGVVTG